MASPGLTVGVQHTCLNLCVGRLLAFVQLNLACPPAAAAAAGALHTFSNKGCDDAEALVILTSGYPDILYPADQLLGLPQQAQICEPSRSVLLCPSSPPPAAAAAAAAAASWLPPACRFCTRSSHLHCITPLRLLLRVNSRKARQTATPRLLTWCLLSGCPSPPPCLSLPQQALG